MMKSPQAGFTLTEVMIVVAIAAVLLAMAVPSVTGQIAKRRLEGAANELSADLSYARTQAVSKNQAVELLSTGTGYTINYVVGPVNPPLKALVLPNGVAVTANVSVVFDSLRGAVASGTTLALASTQTTATLSASVSQMGQVQLCSPGATFIGYATC